MRPINLLPLGLILLCVACSDSSDTLPAPEPLLDRYVLSSQDSIPEGVAFDSIKREFYATSLQGGSITRIEAEGTESLFREADNQVELVGTKVDEDNRLLWVCASNVEGMGDQVWVYDLDSGDLETDFSLGAISTNGSCNDLVLDDAGIAYVTDPVNPNIYRLDATSGEGQVFITDQRFADVTGRGLGLNGIAITPDGGSLIVGKFVPPGLFQVNFSNATSVTPVSLSGDNLPTPDGLAFLNGDLYTVSNSSISRVRFQGDFSAADVITRDQISGLSTATVAEGGLYAIKSEVTTWFINPSLVDLPFEIFQVDIDAFDRPIPPDA